MKNQFERHGGALGPPAEND